MRRERLGSTGIGGGIALPHAVHGDLKRTVAFLAILTTPFDFDALDGKQVDIICLVIGPPNDQNNHLKCISNVTRVLQQAPICSMLRAVTSSEAVLQSLQTIENMAA